MKKYWLVFKNSAQGELAYRFNFFAMFFAEFFSLVVLAYLWASIYHQGNQIGSYTLKSLIIYYILTHFINLTVRAWDVGWVVGDKINLGEINNYLIKPLNFMWHTFFSNVGAVVSRSLVFIFIFLSAVILIFKSVNFNLISIFYFALFLVMAFIINFLISYLIGISTFYLGFVAGFNFMMHNIISFFAGNLMPLDIFPPFLFQIVDRLPFKYIAFVPVSIATGRAQNILQLFFIGLFWIIILYCFAVLLYKRGVKKYDAFGL